MTMKQDITKEDCLLLADQYADAVLRDYLSTNIKNRNGSMARAALANAITDLFQQIETSKMRPVKEIEGVAV